MSDYELENVYEGPNAGVDIVFIHGLRGSKLGTWTSKNGVCWPKDLLPNSIPESRVFLFGYDSGITHRNQSAVTKTEIHSDADDLCAKLAAVRFNTKTDDRPLVFVAHSLGGLVAAQVLVHGESRDDNSSVKSVVKNLRGMIFLGTPFKGSPKAKLAENARKILSAFGVDTQERTLRLLGVDSERLNELTLSFANILNKRRVSKEPSDQIEAFFFYETLKTPGLGQIVEPESAQLPGCGDAAPIAADHHGVCKFQTEKDAGYTAVVTAIMKSILRKSVEDAPAGAQIITVAGNAVNIVRGDMKIDSQTFTFS